MDHIETAFLAKRRAAKGLGQGVLLWDEAIWQANRFALVAKGNTAKFGQNAALRAYLLGTGDRILVEAAPSD